MSGANGPSRVPTDYELTGHAENMVKWRELKIYDIKQAIKTGTIERDRAEQEEEKYEELARSEDSLDIESVRDILFFITEFPGPDTSNFRVMVNPSKKLIITAYWDDNGPAVGGSMTGKFKEKVEDSDISL